MQSVGGILVFAFAVLFYALSSADSSNSDINDIKYYVYTRLNAERAYPIEPDVESIIRSFYQAWKPTIVSIHRLGGSLNSPENSAVVTAKLQQADCNIIVVDWGKLANSSTEDTLNVNLAVANSSTELLLLLKNHFAIELSHIQLVGFSEGAHIAGLVGRNVLSATNLTVQRITGLDPAGGIYATSVAAEARLRPEDAQFVEVIHTNTGALGLLAPIGDVDYYPNGGVKQPGCSALEEADICSHERAYELVREMWSSQNEFVAQKCASVARMNRDSCAWLNVLMGDGSTEVFGVYYVETNEGYPFGKGSFVYTFI